MKLIREADVQERSLARPKARLDWNGFVGGWVIAGAVALAGYWPLALILGVLVTLGCFNPREGQ